MIANLFRILLLILPLVFFRNTSELFEFNKIITLYIFTVLIMATWLYGCTVNRKIIFRRTILDWPLAGHLVALLLSYLVSIDQRTSLLGYYSRFNGGLLSVICYSLLYWAFVSNLNKKQAVSVAFFMLLGTFVASLFAILEHFNIGITCGLMNLGWDTSCWVQDVQSRVYSTFGQPNWIAATIVALIPISNYQFLISKKYPNSRFQIPKLLWGIVSILFFTTLLFTKSRSGLLAFGVESLIFWELVFWKSKFKFIKPFLILNIAFVVLFFVFSFQPITYHLSPITYQAPALETGGTDSVQIRKNVWLGAIDVWRHYPLLGTGVETFAFAYPLYKPIEHNLTSEWDFTYNKAHNEYLNYLATTGTLGIISYFILIFFSIALITNYTNYSKKYPSTKLRNFKIGHYLGQLDQLEISTISGYISILVTNFFGFSVVYTSLLFFLMPAIAVAGSTQHVARSKSKKLNTTQWFFIGVVTLATSYMLHATIRYFVADIYYNKGKLLNRSGDVVKAKEALEKAIKFSPNEAIFWSELSIINNEIGTEESANEAIIASEKAISLSPYNMNVKNTYMRVLTKLTKFNKNYPFTAISVVKSAISISPNDPKLYYQLGLMNLKVGLNKEGLQALEKSVELKPNYKEGRFALGAVYKDLEMLDEAKEQFVYILEKIDPKDELTKKYLEELN